MTAAAAEALELALWLYRAPAHRNALIGRPLPDGVGHLLRIATGAEDALAAGSRITGESAPVVLEAVRFYLQQVLFHENADAYRVLGLQRDATPAQAREHHRLLQHWLHPDRRGSDDWETVFAGRVNRAWTQLRKPESRRAYDEALGSSSGSVIPAQDIEGPVPPHSLRMRWQPSGLEGQAAHGRNVAIAVLAGCFGLLALIAVRPEAPPEWIDEAPRPEPPVTMADAGHPEADAPALSLLRNAFEPPATVETTSPAPTPPPTPPPPGPATAMAAVSRGLPALRAPGPPPPAVATTRQAPDVEAPGREPAIPVAHRPVLQPVVVAAVKPELVPAPAVREPKIALAPVATPTAASPTVAAPTVAAPTLVPIADPLARMAQAQDRAGQVMAYLGDSTARPPPVWNDVHTALAAQAVRDALHARQLDSGRLRLELQSPQWRLSSTGARLESGYRTSKERGRLDIDFVWREDQLLVTAVSLVPAS